MIYSSDHKFLMIKNVKVGGTSLEVELSKILPDNAIVTTINPPNDSHKPRNYDGFYNHMPYDEIERSINLVDVKSYVFVRNPYEMVLSDFFHNLFLYRIDYLKISLEEKNRLLNKYFFIKNNEFSLLTSTKRLYTSKDDKLQANKILRYEDGIQFEINPILVEHGINPIDMKTFEKSYRPKEINYKEVFSKNHIDAIQKEWSWEFDMFGYDK
jgi:hypothetical protein